MSNSIICPFTRTFKNPILLQKLVFLNLAASITRDFLASFISTFTIFSSHRFLHANMDYVVLLIVFKHRCNINWSVTVSQHQSIYLGLWNCIVYDTWNISASKVYCKTAEMYTAAHSLLYTNILFLSASDLTQMELFKVMVTSKSKLAFLLQYVQYIKIILRRNSCIALAINYIDSKIKCNIEEN